MVMRNKKPGFERRNETHADLSDMIPSNEFHLSNVGRSAIINGEIELTYESPDGDPKELWVAIGILPASKNLHLLLYIANDFVKHDFCWTGRVRHTAGAINFFPLTKDIEFKVYDFDASLRLKEQSPPDLGPDKPRSPT